MNDATIWAPVVAALGASGLTVGGTFGLAGWRARQAAKAARRAELRTACQQIIGASLRMAFRAHGLHETMITRSGFGEGLDIVLHVRKPLDPMQLMDYLLQDQGPMFDALTIVWMHGTDELANGAQAIIEAAGEVVGAQAKLEEAQEVQLKSLIGRLRALRRDPRAEETVQETVAKLGRACRSFAREVRRELGGHDLEALADAVESAIEELPAERVGAHVGSSKVNDAQA